MTSFLRLSILTALLLTASCASHKAVTPPTEVSDDDIVFDLERDGSSWEKSIVVQSVREEYQWVAAHHPGLTMKQQSLQFHGKKHPFDVLTFTDSTGKEHTFYFDIGSFYGKF